MAITTKERYKTAKGVEGTTKDERIEIIIEGVQDWIEQYTNYDLQEVDGVTVYPKGFERIAWSMIDFDLKVRPHVSSEKLGKLGVTYNNEYPKSMIKGLKRLKVH